MLCFPNVRVVVIRTIRLILGRTGVCFLRIDVSTDGMALLLHHWILLDSGKFIHQSQRSHVSLMHEIHELYLSWLLENPGAFKPHTNRRKLRYLNIERAVLLVWGFEQCNPWISDHNNGLGMIYVCVWLCMNMQAFKVASNCLYTYCVYDLILFYKLYY